MSKYKVVVMSDSHGFDEMIDEVLEKEQDADLYIHCGDICCSDTKYPNVYTVMGNNDYFGDYPVSRQIEIGNHRIYVTHSHRFSYSQRIKQMGLVAKERECDIVCFGHTHRLYHDEQDGITFINPGSLYMNRDGNQKSYVVMLLDEDKISVEFKFIDKKLNMKNWW